MLSVTLMSIMVINWKPLCRRIAPTYADCGDEYPSYLLWYFSTLSLNEGFRVNFINIFLPLSTRNKTKPRNPSYLLIQIYWTHLWPQGASSLCESLAILLLWEAFPCKGSLTGLPAGCCRSPLSLERSRIMTHTLFPQDFFFFFLIYNRVCMCTFVYTYTPRYI